MKQRKEEQNPIFNSLKFWDETAVLQTDRLDVKGHLIEKVNHSIDQCIMDELKNGVKSSQLWRIISPPIFNEHLPNSVFKHPKCQIF